jgi:hypothetical protein
MAPGLAPKDPGQRRRYNQPARSEWVDLPPVAEPFLPEYPMAWTKRDQRGIVIPRWIWDMWRQDPVTSQYTPADIATLLDLGANYYTLTYDARFKTQTALGLNAKGRRDLRWRTQLEAKQQVEANEKTAKLRRLRVVAEKGAKG